MKITRNLTAPCALLLLLHAGAALAVPNNNSFTSKVTASPALPKVGQNVAFTIVTTSRSLPAGIVDVQVFDARNKSLAQKFWQDEKFVNGKPRTYKWAWKPAAKGIYSIKFGIFVPGWKKLQYWDDGALRLVVK